MYQLNVHLQPGDLDANGHPHQCWDRKREGKSKPFEVEHFDGANAIDAMIIRIKHYQERGITVKLGKKTAEIIGQYQRLRDVL